MTTSTIITYLILALAAGTGGYYVWRKKATPSVLEEDTVDTTVCFDDIVAWFRSLHLDSKIHQCVVVKGSNKLVRKYISKPGYDTIGLLVCDKEGKVLKGKIIHAKGFDKKTKDAFGSHDMIRLA